MLDFFRQALAALLQLATPDATPAGPTVAAVLYNGEEPTEDGLGGCDWDAEDYELCEVEFLIRQAHGEGAQLVVASESAIAMIEPELVGRPGTAPDEENAPVLARFAGLTQELGIYLVLQLETLDGEEVSSSQVALSPAGQLVAVHHKVELYAGEEDIYLAGADVSAFETPFGTVGLLICSDLYADPRLHERMVSELGVDIVALSSVWTVEDAIRWQAAFAHDWGVSLIAANGAAGRGVGAGIFAPTGEPLTLTRRGRDQSLVATLR